MITGCIENFISKKVGKTYARENRVIFFLSLNEFGTLVLVKFELGLKGIFTWIFNFPLKMEKYEFKHTN